MHKVDDPNVPATIQILARDAEYLPLDNATAEVVVSNEAGEELELTAAARDEQAGVYSVDYWPREAGGHRALARVVAPDGHSLRAREVGWVSQPAAAEFASVQPNLSLLKEMAEKTGGEVVSPDQLDRFVRSLTTRPLPKSEVRLEPLWHRPLVLLGVIACLCLEWALRRWHGLP